MEGDRRDTDLRVDGRTNGRTEETSGQRRQSWCCGGPISAAGEPRAITKFEDMRHRGGVSRQKRSSPFPPITATDWDQDYARYRTMVTDIPRSMLECKLNQAPQTKILPSSVCVPSITPPAVSW